jgi:exodeoxyribonuclease-3
MHIISWNVNGLRSVLSKGALQWVSELSPDILCLQEIKMKEDQLPQESAFIFGDYQAYWNSAVRPGYSGVATFTKPDPGGVNFSMGEEHFDVEGRLIQLDFGGFTLFNVYVPNGKRDQTRLSYKLDFYYRLLDMCDDLHRLGKKIIICGDINTAHRPIDLRNPKQNEKISGFLPEERAWIDTYLEHGFVDVYREIYAERIEYTWWTYRFNARLRNIGWRIDYFMVSKDLLKSIKDAVIYDDIMGSDHCPIGLEIRI